ncbi:MAG TPA: LysR family transcriptional regulator [Leptolyngbyaceae cyanobacterium M33_DOE_097]|uniref:LysR family transcriptional regulator n=1 Tax=Oscillatoriales cyanobacterium SpSt-418 TaxID=2282169 RepID=A0A7C3PRT3_9CYAN|nr:LysR family transcriptional regulator [Leptolyngbyaceae cyanobacterium M33_DOE_097]
MANIELRALQYFVAVAEELNFGRAADRLQIAQPPLSRQIQKLEKDLGVDLLDRLNRRTQLTAAGQTLLQEARLILRQVEQGIAATQRAGRGETGRFVVGFEGSFSYDIMPRAIKVFQEQYPTVELIVQEMTTGEQEQALLARQIDLGFVVLPIDDSDLSIETVWREKLVLVLPESHPMATQPEIKVTDLSNESIIAGPHEKGCGLFIHILRIFAEAGFSPKIVQITHEIQMLLGFVAAGLGISLLPATNQFFQRPGVIYRQLPLSSPDVELAIAWKSDNSSPILQHFIAQVRGICRQNNG